VSRSPFGPAFFASIAIHLGALLVISLSWDWVRPVSPPSSPNETGLIMVVPVPPPVIPVESEEIAAPPPETEEITMLPASPPLPSESMTPQPAVITPPKLVEQTVLKRVEPRPKPLPSPKPARVKKPSPDIMHEAATGPRDSSTAGDQADSKPGPRFPLPDETRETAAGNVLGPPSAHTTGGRPVGPIEGGEAGAGNVSEQGDVGVIPRSGAGGGSGAHGRGGLGLGDGGSGARVSGIRPGPGGEGSGEGGDSTSLPRGGYQAKPRYPDSVRRRGIEGTVVVKAYVTQQGRVEGVQVEQSAGHPDLDQAAVEAVGRWRFEPAHCGRQPVAMWVSIPVKFMLSR
jgi:periplasmic protein TonB